MMGRPEGCDLRSEKLNIFVPELDGSPDRVEDQVFLAPGTSLKNGRPVQHPAQRRWGRENRNNIRKAEK